MLVILVLALAAWPAPAASLSCRLRPFGQDYAVQTSYGGRGPVFTVNFNTTWQQANYVAYVSTAGGNRCADCAPGDTVCKDRVFAPVSYSILADGDYTGSGYSRGHLVPRTDLGCSTMVISNAAPMLETFNGGAWMKTEDAIRAKYAGHLVVKGCAYVRTEYYLSRLGNRLYLPTGCHYAVFAETSLAAAAAGTASTAPPLELLAYSYCDQGTGKCHERLPEWLDCSGLTPVDEAVDVLVAVVVVALVALAAVAACVFRKCRRTAKTHHLRDPEGNASDLGGNGDGDRDGDGDGDGNGEADDALLLQPTATKVHGDVIRSE